MIARSAVDLLQLSHSARVATTCFNAGVTRAWMWVVLAISSISCYEKRPVKVLLLRTLIGLCLNRRGVVARPRNDGLSKVIEDNCNTTRLKSQIVFYDERCKNYCSPSSRRNKRIWDAWLACYTLEEIEQSLGLGDGTLKGTKWCDLDTWQKNTIFSQYQDPKWKLPLYDVWKTGAGEQTQNRPRLSLRAVVARLPLAPTCATIGHSVASSFRNVNRERIP